MTDIGKNIKRILKDENMTQAELARRTGMPRSVISEIVNGKRKIVRLDTLEIMEELCYELCYELAEIIREEGEKE